MKKYLFIIFIFILHISLGSQLTSRTQQICNYEYLPSSFNSLSYLDFNGEFAFFDSFNANYEWNTQEIFFQLNVTSAIRFYVSPKNTIDIDLWLFRNGTRPEYLQHSSLGIGGEEVIESVLEAGVYALQFIFIGSNSNNCDPLNLEASIVPLQRLLERTSRYTCPSNAIYPQIDFTVMENTPSWYVHFDSGSFDYIAPREDSSNKNDVKFLKGYNFTIPSDIALWRVTIDLGFDFLTSGSLGLIIIKNDGKDPKLCSQEDGCTLGVDDKLNHNVIKTVLAPGNYSLWIYDTIGEQNATLAPCSPFSLKVDIEKLPQVESFLTCPYEKLPSTLETPGLIDSAASQAYFVFQEKLLVSSRISRMRIQINELSYFRAWLNEHRLDLDIYLIDSSENIIAASYSLYQEENIAYVLSPGTYYLSLVIFGSYSPQFCETYDIMFSIARMNETIDVCHQNGEVLNIPFGFPDLTQELSANQYYKFNGLDKIFSFPYVEQYSGVKTIASTTFEIFSSFNMKISVDYNFIYGNVDLLIKNLNEPNFVPIKADHYQSTLVLSRVLGAGNYSIELSTGATQTNFNTDNLSQFPKCYRYKFEIEFEPVSSIKRADSSCWSYLNLPTNLNTPGYLEQSKIVHISQDYYIPQGRVVQREIVFTVEERSFFRIYTDPNSVDIDIYLLESGSQVARAIQYNKEESIVWFLDPKEEYIVRFYFFRFGVMSSSCESFRLELAIEPTSYLISTCQGDNLPSKTLIPSDPSKYPFTSENFYSYTQKNETFVYDIPFSVLSPPNFNVSDVAVIRVLTRFNFLWGHFSLYIISAETNQTISTGIANEASTNDLLPFNLIAGNYILRLSQPATSSTELERCVTFSMKLLIDSVASEQVGDYGCLPSSIETNLNNAAGLTNITQQRVLISTVALARVEKAYDYMDFVLNERSVMRAFIPSHPQIDIDLILARGNHIQYNEVIAASLGYEEETIYKDLDPGSYVLFYRFLPFRNQQLPKPSDCPSFPTEFAVYPYSYLSNITSISISCDEVLPPTTLIPNQQQNVYFQRDPSQNLNHEIRFTVSNIGSIRFTAHLSFEFLTSNVYMVLSSTIGPKIVSNLGTNRAYIDAVLSPGDWVLTLSSTSSSISNINCARATLSYYLNTTVDPSDCVIHNDLPTDFYSQQGGSIPYGGPQAQDGSVVIVGDLFNIPPQSVNKYMSFFVNQPSVVRVYTDAGQDVDLDLYIYNSTTEFTYNTLVQYSIGIGPTESKQVLLEPTTNGDNYTVGIHSYYVSNQISPCTYFHFEFAMAPKTKVIDDLSCPLTFPDPEVPPQNFNFYPGSIVVLNSAEYLFSQQRIDQYLQANPFAGNEYKYEMNIVAHSTTILSAMISYNFLENDFDLKLRDTSGKLITSGYSFDVNQRSVFYNFATTFFVQLPPGVYKMQIVEKLLSSFTMPPNQNYCHKFQFYMFFISDEANPTITTIYPASSIEVDPTTNLNLHITFSNPIVYPNTTNLQEFLSTQKPIYLIDQQDYSRIYPSVVEILGDLETLYVVFPSSALNFNKRYLLNIDANKFLSSNSSFSFPNATQYIYQTKSCQCNGHGNCDNFGNCNCSYPYVGVSCNSCDVGYHSAGTLCVQNTHCQPNTCNGHGSCEDTFGYPVCTCYDGYSTFSEDHCSICSSGYSGYPNCTSFVNPVPEHCDAKLLPNDFDGPGYLADDGRLHIYDVYFVDYSHFRHDILFSLSKDSIIRIYVEPHLIDIDLWLYQLNDDGSVHNVLHMGIGAYGEESLYQVLKGNANKKIKYRITFRYYNTNPSIQVSPCQTGNFEFAIQPVDLAVSESNQFLSSVCQSSNNLPEIEQFQDGVTISNSDSFEFTSNTIYTVNPSLNSPNFFFNRTFHIVTQPNEIALISVKVSNRFLTGDLSLLLEHKISNDGTVCSRSSSECEFGYNTYNFNHLDSRIPSGNYTFRLYEPLPQNSSLSPCSAFTFSMSIKFVAATSTIYNCPGSSELTETFNEPGFLDSTGHMHFVDNFVLGQYINRFNLVNDSSFRFSSYSEFGWTASLYNSEWQLVHSVTQEDEKVSLKVFLTSGTYYFSLFYAYVENSVDICQTARVEFQISPHFGSNTNRLICPFSGIDLLPSLPENLPSQYEFSDNLRTFYSFQTTQGVIWSYNFTIQENSQLTTSVSSHFLSTDLTIKLYQNREDGGLETSSLGINDYNFNSIYEDIGAGSYMLVIFLPNNYTNPHVTCYGFNFNFMLSNSSNQCKAKNLDKFATLNTFRFLRSDKKINFQANNFLIPPNLVFNIRKDINVSVVTRSSLRVFVAPHERIDIDIFLFKIDSNGIRTVVTQAPNGFKGEETLVATLETSFSYQIELSFWNWNSGVPIEECSLFDMAISISPLTPLPQVCANGAHWPVPPPSTGMPSTPYSYSDNQYNAELFYYQQQTTGLASRVYTFTLSDFANIYISVGFEFSSGSLLIKLLNADSGAIIAYGANFINRNELRALGVAAGNYSIVLTETVINNIDIIGCSPFTYTISIEKDDRTNVAYYGYELPETLDVLPYLQYNSRVELNEYYIVYYPNQDKNVMTSFTPKFNSYLRVSAFLIDSNDKIAISLFANGNEPQNLLIANTSTLSFSLTASTKYYLSFNIFRFFILSTKPIPMNFQLNIEPITLIQSDINTYTPVYQCNAVTLPSNIQISQSGYYTFNKIISVTSSSFSVAPNPVVSYNFQLKQKSVLYASVETNFLLNYLEWKLVKNGLIVIPSYTTTNINQLDNLLEAGSYSLILNSVSPFQDPQRCVLYKVSLFIRPYTSNDPHSDCSNFDILPFELNSNDGGSVPFGGPIKNGELEFHGSNFLFPTVNGALEFINFTLSSDSLISLFIRSRNNYLVSNFLQISSNNQYVNPLTSLPGVMSSIFHNYHVLPQTQTNYYLSLSFNDITQSNNCPTFSLDISLVKKTNLQSLLLCPISYLSVLPNPQVSVNETGFAHQNVHTYIPSNSISLSGGYNISLSVTSTSRLQITLGFNSKVSYFNVTILNLTNGRITRLPLSVITNKNRETDLERTLNVFVRAGDYIITITQPPFNTDNIGFDASRIYCLPFEWNLFLLPYFNRSTFTSISPPSGYNLSPVNDLVLSFSFSRNIYDSSNTQITFDNIDVLYQSIILSSNSKKREFINPKSVTTNDNLVFVVTFDHFKFTLGVTYQVILVPNKIFDSNQVAVLLPTTNSYSMLSGDCGGHGNLDTNYNCKCNIGYAGVVGPCTSCDIGYINVANSGEPVKCIKNDTQVCSTTSCGCSHTDEQPDVCIPLGKCDDTSGKVVCNCSSNYKGAYCEFCADGYQSNYPLCQPPSCTPECKNGGICQNSICKCVGNWEGSTCNVCKPNYSGENCEIVNIPGVTSQYKYLLIGGILFLILLAFLAVLYFVLKYFKNKRARTRIDFDLDDEDDNDFFGNNENHATELQKIDTEKIYKSLQGENNEDEKDDKEDN